MKLEPLPKFLKYNYDSDALIYKSDNHFYYNLGVSKDLINDLINKQFQIYNAYYLYEKDWESPKIMLIGRGLKVGKFKIKVQGFLPYLYLKNKNGKYKTYLGDKVEKVLFKTEPKRIAKFRDYCKKQGEDLPYEADILFHRRFLCDTYDYFKPKQEILPKVAIIDLETNHPIGKNLISFSVNDPDGDLYHNSYYINNQSEFDLALDLYEYLSDFDLITGWNITFDIKILEDLLTKIKLVLEFINNHKLKEKEIINYYKQLKLSKKNLILILKALEHFNYIDYDKNTIKINKYLDNILSHNFTILDSLTLTKKMYGREIKGRWTLDNTGIQLVGMSKKNLNGKHIYELNELELMEYNTIDTIIPEVIDNAFGGILGHTILAWSLQSCINDIVITAVANDIALIRAYHKDKIVLNSRDFDDADEDETYNAANPDAIVGSYTNLVELDLEAAYANAVLSINASCETKDPNGKYKAPNGVRFNNGYSTFISTLKELMLERKKIKKILKSLDKHSDIWKRYKSIDFALKTQVAAFSHGIFGWSKSRMKDLEVADAITSVVRELIESVKHKCGKLGYKWCYVHTDSIVINTSKSNISTITNLLNSHIKDYCRKMNYNNVPNLEFKQFYKVGYIHSPARNVLIPEDGSIDDVDTWKVTGMNFMRSEVPPALVDIEVNLIKMKLRGKNNEEMIDWLRNRLKDTKNLDSRDLGIIKPLNRSIKKYGKTLQDGSHGNIPYHIKALMLAEREYGFKVPVGSKFMILPILTNETVGVRVIRRKKVLLAFSPEIGLPKQYKIDFEYYFRDNLFGKINKLFDMTPSELESTLNLKW